MVKTGNWASERIAPTAEKIEKMERKNGRTKKLTTKKWTSINWKKANGVFVGHDFFCLSGKIRKQSIEVRNEAQFCQFLINRAKICMSFIFKLRIRNTCIRLD
ncbi:MAG: hypothetical protein WBO93_10400 [Gammaproteobacteria bacterium]